MEIKDGTAKAMVEALDRQATAAEKLVAIAEQEQIQFERGPTICPNCGRFNPEVQQLHDDGSGPIDEFVMMAETLCCQKVVYAVADGWAVTIFKDQAAAFINQKKGGA